MTRTLIGCPATEELLGNGGYGAMAAGTATAQRNFSHMQHNSYGAYGILTEFSSRQRRNGNGRMATEWWKPGVIFLASLD